jgi:hypothetical protein
VEQEISNKERRELHDTVCFVYSVLPPRCGELETGLAAVARTRSQIKYIEKEPRGRVNKKLDRSWEEWELVEGLGVTQSSWGGIWTAQQIKRPHPA